MRKVLFVLTLLLLSCALAIGQTRQITGTVTGQDDGLPLPGVSVIVKGTTVGVLTDAAGKYAISAADNQILVFSFVGMKSQEIPVAGKTVIDVAMTSDLMNLDEVVVVGYGTAKKVGTVVGSLTQVNAKTVEEKPVANIMDALQGKVAGLSVLTSSGEPSAIASIRLHGNGSLSGSTTPLYVLDGTPIDEGTMLSLNSNDFESVTILKDASATSIYGTRAANGVIYITTKRGALDTKGRVKVSLIRSYSSIADETFYKSFMNTKELTDFWVTSGYRTQTYVDNLLAAYPNDTQWYKYYYKNNAPSLNADVSVSGGGGKTTYYVSGSYFSSQGIADRSLYDRLTLRSNINTKVNDWLSMGINLLGSSDDRETNAYGSNSTNRGLALLAQPFFTPYDANGKEYPDMIPGWGRYNPKYLAKKLPQSANNYQFDGTGYIQLNPINGLTIKSQGGMDAYDFYRVTKRMPSYKGSLNNGSLTEEYYQGVTSTLTNTAEYKFTLAQKNNFTVLLGQEGIVNNYHGFTAASTGQTDDRLMQLENGPNGKTNTTDRSQYAFLSYFGRIDYSLLDKYFLDFSARQDASSRFGKNNRTANFYAAGIMWNAKKESFLINSNIVSSMNIKFSIGTSGNAEIGNYNHLATIGANQYDNGTGWVVSSAGNSSLGWEKQIQSTLGFKFGLFEDAYRFNVEFYNRVTTNMLVDVPYPYTSGFPSVLGNVGKLRNRGVDVQIDFDIVKNKNLFITPYINFNYNNEEILSLFQGYNYWIIPNTGTCWPVGKPVSFFYPIWAGVNPDDGYSTWYVPGADITKTTTNTTTEDFNDADLQQNLGKPVTPPWNGGFGFTAGYKGFSLQADFTFSYKKYLINNDRYFFENPDVFAGYNQVRRIQDFWQQPGDKTLFPAFGTQFTQFDSRLCEDASFMRLKYLSLSYNVPSSILQKTKFFSDVRVYVAGRNLWTLTNYLGPDPEIDSNLSLGAYPNTKQILFGVDLSF